MAITQTYYLPPIHPLLGVVIFGIIIAITCILTSIDKPSAVDYLFIALNMTYLLTQPDLACLRTKRKQADGSTIKIRKPFIGFTTYERVEYEEDFETDAIHERAFVRI